MYSFFLFRNKDKKGGKDESHMLVRLLTTQLSQELFFFPLLSAIRFTHSRVFSSMLKFPKASTDRTVVLHKVELLVWKKRKEKWDQLSVCGLNTNGIALPWSFSFTLSDDADAPSLCDERCRPCQAFFFSLVVRFVSSVIFRWIFRNDVRTQLSVDVFLFRVKWNDWG